MMPCTSCHQAVQPQEDGMVRQADPAAPTGHQVIRS
jgi:hypothetical protein